MEPQRLAYTVEEVAKMLDVSLSIVYRAVENGTLPYKRLAGGYGKGRIIIPAEALEKWLKRPDMPRAEKVRR
ncbi:helix-turn-helix domain-containing protein [Carboxydothermus pertinax]|uniref:DNA-binding protein n=1 Tax=Carboxydothermus pertinax TaxID=870242 RepID=A0A1L8CUT5_9THEO|nr:helix-turn-helix domain-containing protein [Carboxydothermus pertinax]GAV22662.1 DNA-binding protein [Carboxydothermus pertinax]